MIEDLILIRHGESEGNVDQQVYIDTLDPYVKLTEKGMEEARASAKELAVNMQGKTWVVFFSPYERAAHTWRIIEEELKEAGIKYSAYEEPLVREHEWGLIPNNVEEINACKALYNGKAKFWYRFPNGESLADVDQRIFMFFSELFHEKHKNTLIVTHGNAIKVMTRRLMALSTNDIGDLGYLENAGYITLNGTSLDPDRSKGRVYLDSINKLLLKYEKERDEKAL